MEGCNNHDDHRIGHRGVHHGDAATWRNHRYEHDYFYTFSPAIQHLPRTLPGRPVARGTPASTIFLRRIHFRRSPAKAKQRPGVQAGSIKRNFWEAGSQPATGQRYMIALAKASKGSKGRDDDRVQHQGRGVGMPFSIHGCLISPLAAGSADGAQQLMRYLLATPSRKRRRLMERCSSNERIRRRHGSGCRDVAVANATRQCKAKHVCTVACLS